MQTNANTSTSELAPRADNHSEQKVEPWQFPAVLVPVRSKICAHWVCSELLNEAFTQGLCRPGEAVYWDQRKMGKQAQCGEKR